MCDGSSGPPAFSAAARAALAPRRRPSYSAVAAGSGSGRDTLIHNAPLLSRILLQLLLLLLPSLLMPRVPPPPPLPPAAPGPAPPLLLLLLLGVSSAPG